MKKYIMIVMCILCMLLSSCKITQMQIKGDEELNPLIEIATRRIAYKIINNEPDKIDYLISKCDEILKEDIKDNYGLIESGFKYVLKRFSNDVTLQDDIISLAKYYGVKLKEPTIELDIGERRSLQKMTEVFRDILIRHK